MSWRHRHCEPFFHFIFKNNCCISKTTYSHTLDGVIPWVRITPVLHPFSLSTSFGRWNSVIPFTSCLNSNNLFIALLSLAFFPQTLFGFGRNAKIIPMTFHHQTTMFSLLFLFGCNFFVLRALLFASQNAQEGLEINTGIPLAFLLLQQVGSFESKQKYTIQG